MMGSGEQAAMTSSGANASSAPSRVRRRRFLHLSSGIAATALLAACGATAPPTATQPSATKGTTGSTTSPTTAGTSTAQGAAASNATPATTGGAATQAPAVKSGGKK